MDPQMIDDIIIYTNKRLRELENMTPPSELKHYYILEEELIARMQISKQKKLKYTIFNMLYNSFFTSDEEARREIEKTFKHLFYFFYYSFNSDENRARMFLSLDGTETPEVLLKKKRTTYNTVWKCCLKHIIEHYKKIEVIPEFLLAYEKRLLKSKLNINLQRHYKYPIESILASKYEHHQFLEKTFKEIVENKQVLFNPKVFNEEERMSCFGLLVFANYEYINQRDQNKKIFFNNVKKYITVLNLKSKYNEMIEIVKTITTEKGYDYQAEKEKNLKTILDIKEKDKEPYLMIVLSFSCLLNSLIVEKETMEKKEIGISSKLKCSAKERQFLINILKALDALQLNHFIETYIFQNMLRNQAKGLFEENTNAKLLIKYPYIIDCLSKVHTMNPKDNSLNEIEAKVFGTLFDKFQKDREGLFVDKEENMLAAMVFKNSISMTLIMNLPGLYFNNQHPFRTSTHICIGIDGQYSNKVAYYRNVPLASLCHNTHNTNADFYYLSWQNDKNFFKLPTEDLQDQIPRESIINKKIAKVYGKFLAYIIVSRSIFKYQSISLMGFSLGCHVIKHCLLELNKLSGKMDTDDIIKDIIFISGATTIDKDKYPTIFSNVAGNVVNVHNENDTMLKSYDEQSIGLRQLKINDPIINIDLSRHPLMTQEELKGSLNKILTEDIKLY